MKSYTTAEAAKEIGVSPRRIRALIKTGWIKTRVANDRGDHMISAATVEWVKANRRPRGRPPGSRNKKGTKHANAKGRKEVSAENRETGRVPAITLEDPIFA